MAGSDKQEAGMETPAEVHVEYLQTQEDENPQTLPWNLALAVFSVALSLAAPILMISLLSTVVTQVTTKLGDPTDQSWPISAFSVGGATSFSITGNLSDTFGRRLVIIIGNIMMVVGAIVGASAYSVHQLIAAESIIGFATGIVFVGYASISELLPNKWRGAGVGLTEFLNIIPWSLAATLIAVSIYSNAALSWRWFYIIGTIYALLSLVGVSLFYFPPTRPLQDYDKTRWQQIKEIDFVGCLLFSGGLCVTLVGLTWAGTRHPWKSAAVIVPIVIGVCSITCAFIYDIYVPVSPLFPTNLICEIRKYVLLLYIAFFAGFVFYSMSALLPQATLFIFTNDPIKIGITQLPNGVGQLIFGSIASAAIGIVGHLRMQLVFWTTVMVVGATCLAATIPNSKAAFMTLQPFAVGPFPTISALTIVIASLNIPLRYLGVAIGLIGTLRSAGGSIGNAVLQTILNSIVNDKLGPAIIDSTVELGFNPQYAAELIGATVQNAVGVPASFAAVPGATPEIQHAASEALRAVYIYAFKRVFYTIIPFGVVAIICAVLIHDPSQQLTNHTAVRMEKEGLMGKGKKHNDQQSYKD